MGFRFTEITFDGITNQVQEYLEKKYKKARDVFSPASPYGQILDVVKRLYSNSILYLKTSVNQFILSDRNNQNYDIIRSAAIVAGHDPSRAVSATGTLKFTLRQSISVEDEIPGQKIRIDNFTQIKNKTNGLKYIIDLGGSDSIVLNLNSTRNFFVNIKQGEIPEPATFTGTGELNQSFVVEGISEIEQYSVKVFVNDELIENKKHLREILPQQKACVVRTSFDGGVSILFGNDNTGFIPALGDLIRVEYIKTQGSSGNIFRRTINDFEFEGAVFDGNGAEIDFEEFFDVFISTDINFGVDRESIDFMRNIIPLNSNNFILALPEQYAYAIKRLGVFSYVNAFRRNNQVVINATPNIKLFKNRNSDYFSVDRRAFELDEYEIFKIDQYLKKGGYIQLTDNYVFRTPKLSFYVMNVFLRLFDDAQEELVNSEIIDRVSEYFLDLNRFDRIPKKDLIKLIGAIEGVDSVDISFISKKNEDYHINSSINPDYDSDTLLGIDPILGDIIFEKDEYPIIRGGFRDRQGIYFSDVLFDGLSTLNIIIEGTTNRTSTL